MQVRKFFVLVAAAFSIFLGTLTLPTAASAAVQPSYYGWVEVDPYCRACGLFMPSHKLAYWWSGSGWQTIKIRSTRRVYVMPMWWDESGWMRVYGDGFDDYTVIINAEDLRVY